MINRLRTLLAPFVVALVLFAPTHLHAEGNTPGSIFDSISSFGQGLGLGFQEQPRFLKPDDAFIFSSEIQDPNTLVLRWDVAENYYLYRGRFAFKLVDTEGVELLPFRAPKGVLKEDENFGEMEVYFNEAVVTLPLKRTNLAAMPLTLSVTYQGCAEDGFCYPPITKTAEFDLSEASVSEGSVDSSTPVFVPEHERIAQELAGDGWFLTVLSFFGIGLLLAFTPCVLPMMPILSSIIVGEGEKVTTRRAFSLSLTYVLAMSLTYTVAGVLAGMFGQNLQIMFQDPWIIGSFSLLFVVLAMSMFGFYELQMPSAIQSRLDAMSRKQSGGTLIGAGVMGFLSALIVGPCVAAPLAGILIYIGMSGDAVFGGLSLFVLSLGMGTPLLLFGTSAGKLLPKLGAWMDSIKAVFGVMLLGLAIWMLERVIPAQIAMFLWAILLIGTAVYLGALTRLESTASGWQKLWKGLGLVMLIYGVIVMLGASIGGRDVLQPMHGTTLMGGGSKTEAHLTFKTIKSLADLESEVKNAASQNQAVMFDFYADWCVDCKIMEKRTFTDVNVHKALDNVLLLQADVTPNDEIDQELLQAFGLFGPPAILFFDTNGNEIKSHRVIGFMAAEEFAAHVNSAL
ncbi:MAG: protein-disulfide reductase DsbD [Gammaproteobacteria bacterium]|nr:protein-disulfide reductase DsbD [Gammaproteobacteria bacterium]